MSPGFIPPHGGYQSLHSYRKAEVVSDATVRFCASSEYRILVHSRICLRDVPCAGDSAAHISARTAANSVRTPPARLPKGLFIPLPPLPKTPACGHNPSAEKCTTPPAGGQPLSAARTRLPRSAQGCTLAP